MEPTIPVSKSKPVLLMTAVLATIQVILGGSALSDVLDPKVYGLLALIFAAVQVGWGIYSTGLVTPWVDVVAKVGAAGNVVAGPAARQLTGTPVTVTDDATGEVTAPPPDPKRNEQGAISLLGSGLILLIAGVCLALFTRLDGLGYTVGVVGGCVVVIAVVMGNRDL